MIASKVSTSLFLCVGVKWERMKPKKATPYLSKWSLVIIELEHSFIHLPIAWDRTQFWSTVFPFSHSFLKKFLHEHVFQCYCSVTQIFFPSEISVQKQQCTKWKKVQSSIFAYVKMKNSICKTMARKNNRDRPKIETEGDKEIDWGRER